MKLLFKRVNRGLILSLLCLTILTTYIIYDYVSYHFSRDELISLTRSCFEDTCSINNLFNEKSESNYNKSIDIIDNYWTDSTHSFDEDAYSVSTLKSQKEFLKKEFDSNTDTEIHMPEYSFENFYVNKRSTGYARVSVSIKFNTDDDHFCFFTPYGIISDNIDEDISDDSILDTILEDYDDEDYDDEDYDDDYEDAEIEDDNTERFNLVFEYKRSFGTWKLVAVINKDNETGFFF